MIRVTNLVLFPYAGSLGLAYNAWMKRLRNDFLVSRIDYTGLNREHRYYECRSWEELCDRCYEKLMDLNLDEDTIFYGHSMGARMQYEMYKRLLAEHRPCPSKIIFSGCESLKKITNDPYKDSEEKFRQEYIEMGGISDQVLACQELAELAFEALKKDVYLLSQFRFEPVKMNCQVTILNGMEDDYTTKEEWEDTLDCKVSYKMFEGKHFFIYDYEDDVLDEFYTKV